MKIARATQRALRYASETGAWPEKLYKYRSLSTEEDVRRALRIIDGHIFAAHRSQFNDPFDCAPVMVRAIAGESTENYVNRIVRELNPHASRTTRRAHAKFAIARVKKDGFIESAVRALNTTYDNFGVVSLSTKPDDLLMWSHYAAEHTGVCIGFSLASGSDFKRSFPVAYSRARPVLAWPLDDEGDLVDLAFLTKAECWSYESEWRMIERGGPHELAFSREFVCEVIFGAKINSTQETRIRQHLDSRKDLVEVLSARLHENEYRIVIGPALKPPARPSSS